MVTNSLIRRASFAEKCALVGILALTASHAEARTLAEIRATNQLRICVAGSSAPFYRANAEYFAQFLAVTPVATQLPDWDQQFQDASGAVVKEGRYEAHLLATGKCDVFPNDLHMTDWRRTKMLLVPNYTTRKMIVAHRSMRQRIKHVADLAGHSAAVQKGTAYDTWIDQQNKSAYSGNPVVIGIPADRREHEKSI